MWKMCVHWPQTGMEAESGSDKEEGWTRLESDAFESRRNKRTQRAVIPRDLAVWAR